jgi:lipopolysaccharide biosynthesis regulator YciM
MEFDFSWLLLGLPLAFALGWWASRQDLRQIRLENRQAPKAYFKGLNHLLNEEQDQAIDAFIEAVQRDPDTSELHFALGNLFRRRGEYQRAVRVHEHLLSRADLASADRYRAQYALALDFLKAGLLDRAEHALQQLMGTPLEGQALLALLGNFERSRDWAQAASVAQRLQDQGLGDFRMRLAHYLCEQASPLVASGQSAQAQALLEQALAHAPQSARPPMALAQLHLQQGHAAQAYATLSQALQAAPSAIALLAQPLAQAADAAQCLAQAREALSALYDENPALDLLAALVWMEQRLSPQPQPAQALYQRHLEREPSLVATAQLLALAASSAALGQGAGGEIACSPGIRQAVSVAAKPLMRYRCAACGFEASQHFWQCPGCQTWDSYPARRVEEL